MSTTDKKNRRYSKYPRKKKTKKYKSQSENHSKILNFKLDNYFFFFSKSKDQKLSDHLENRKAERNEEATKYMYRYGLEAGLKIHIYKYKAKDGQKYKKQRHQVENWRQPCGKADKTRDEKTTLNRSHTYTYYRRTPFYDRRVMSPLLQTNVKNRL